MVQFSPNNGYYHIVAGEHSKLELRVNFQGIPVEYLNDYTNLYISLVLRRTNETYKLFPIDKVCDGCSCNGLFKNPVESTPYIDQKTEFGPLGALNVFADMASIRKPTQQLEQTIHVSFPCKDSCARGSHKDLGKESARDSCLEFRLMYNYRCLNTGKTIPVALTTPTSVNTWIKASITKWDLESPVRRRAKGSTAQIYHARKRALSSVDTNVNLPKKIKTEPCLNYDGDELVAKIVPISHMISDADRRSILNIIEPYFTS